MATETALYLMLTCRARVHSDTLSPAGLLDETGSRLRMPERLRDAGARGIHDDQHEHDRERERRCHHPKPKRDWRLGRGDGQERRHVVAADATVRLGLCAGCSSSLNI